MSTKEPTINNPLIFNALKNFVKKYMKPEADNIEVESGLEEARREYGSTMTMSEALYEIEHPSDSNDHPWIDIWTGIDWQAVEFDRATQAELTDAAEKIKQGLSAGIIEPRDVGLYKRPPPEYSIKEKKAWKARIQELEERLSIAGEEARKEVPPPKFKVGEKVAHTTFGVSKILNMRLTPLREWMYVIKGTPNKFSPRGEYEVKESELLEMAQEAKAPIVLPPIIPKRAEQTDIEALNQSFEIAIRNRLKRPPTNAEYNQFTSCVEFAPNLDEAKRECKRLVDMFAGPPPSEERGRPIGEMAGKPLEEMLPGWFEHWRLTNKYKAEEEARKAERPPPMPPRFIVKVLDENTGFISKIKFHDEIAKDNYITGLVRYKHLKFVGEESFVEGL